MRNQCIKKTQNAYLTGHSGNWLTWMKCQKVELKPVGCWLELHSVLTVPPKPNVDEHVEAVPDSVQFGVGVALNVGESLGVSESLEYLGSPRIAVVATRYGV
jgi:hypothetical protein